MPERYDAVVIGAGPGGEHVVARLYDQGLRVAICERELLGGECAYWACIPSKVLLRPPELRSDARRAAGVSEPALDFADAAAYRDEMVRHLDDTKQAQGYAEKGIGCHRGQARIAGPGRVEVGGEVLETERIVVATGTDAAIPPIDGLEQAGYWTNREATNLSELPRSAVVLGGGPVGIELAQMLARFGTRVALVQSGSRLLPREDPLVGDLIADTLREDGIDLRLDARAEAVSSDGDERVVRLDDGAELRAEQVVVAVGRRPRVEGIGLETVGIEPGEKGIEVDERCRAAEGVWALGDVTGVSPFTHVAKYQARIVAADIAGERVSADYSAIPRVVFSDPEIAAVGLTEAQAREQGVQVATSRVDLAATIARPVTYARDPKAEMGFVADRERGVLVGAWAFAPLAGEWIHTAGLAIKTATPLAVLRDTVPQFPTFSEGYLNAVESLEL